MRFKKSTCRVQKVHFLGGPTTPKIDPGYRPVGNKLKINGLVEKNKEFGKLLPRKCWCLQGNFGIWREIFFFFFFFFFFVYNSTYHV